MTCDVRRVTCCNLSGISLSNLLLKLRCQLRCPALQVINVLRKNLRTLIFAFKLLLKVLSLLLKGIELLLMKFLLTLKLPL